MTEESLRLSVVRLISDVYEKLIDLETRLSALEEVSTTLPLGYSRLVISTLLSSHFDVSELNELAFSLSLDSDMLSGGTRNERVRSLVAYCERHGMIDQLLNECQRSRPSVTWPRWTVED